MNEYLLAGLATVSVTVGLRTYFRGKLDRIHRGRVWRDKFLTLAQALAEDERTPAEALETLQRFSKLLHSTTFLLQLTHVLANFEEITKSSAQSPLADKLPDDLRSLWNRMVFYLIVAATYNLPIVGLVARERLLEILDGPELRKRAEAVVARATRVPRRRSWLPALRHA